MKIGALIKGVQDARIGIVILVEPMNQYSEHWCRVFWVDGHLTWETSNYLEVIA